MRDKVLSRKTAALYLGISVRTLDRWAKAGKIPSVKMGRRIYFSLHQIFEVLEIEQLSFEYFLIHRLEALYLTPRKAKKRWRDLRRLHKKRIEFMELFHKLTECKHSESVHKKLHSKLKETWAILESILSREFQYLTDEGSFINGAIFFVSLDEEDKKEGKVAWSEIGKDYADPF